MPAPIVASPVESAAARYAIPSAEEESLCVCSVSETGSVSAALEWIAAPENRKIAATRTKLAISAIFPFSALCRYSPPLDFAAIFLENTPRHTVTMITKIIVPTINSNMIYPPESVKL